MILLPFLRFLSAFNFRKKNKIQSKLKCLPLKKLQVSTVLWSKTVIFRFVYCNLKMPPSYWDPLAFITHTCTFKWSINLKGLKSYHSSKFECLYFLSKTHFTFLLWLITFEPLESANVGVWMLKELKGMMAFLYCNTPLWKWQFGFIKLYLWTF